MPDDPVCKMILDKAVAAASSENRGITYYFCSFSCKKAFDDDPLKYVEGQNNHHKNYGC